jgi:hypothetical protein
VVCVVQNVEKTKSAAGQFAVKYKSETHCWTQKLNKEDYGFDKYWVLLSAVVKQQTQLIRGLTPTFWLSTQQPDSSLKP